jgi:hypothetical protein
MPAFVVLEPPGYPERAIEHADRFVFLRDKFSLGAFLFGPLWLIWRRLWVVLVAYVLGIALIGYGLRALGTGWSVVVLVFVLVHLLVGLEATTLVRWTRSIHGWRECGVVIADDIEMAERRFFDNRAALRQAARPGSTLSPGQLPAGQVGPSRPDVIGLFPEPGGGR